MLENSAMDQAEKIDNEQNKLQETSIREKQPFGGLEFQVSEVVGRLEASVNSQETASKNVKTDYETSSGFYEPETSPMDSILRNLEDLVLKTDPSNDSLDPPLMPTDSITRAAILSHSIIALFSRLERSHAARISANISEETTRWMAHMFRLSDYHAFYHQEQLEGLVRVTRMLLHHKYPRYLEDGALAFTTRFPSVYSCVASALGVVQHLCRQLGLPLVCVRPVPLHSSGRGMDLEALAKLYEEDVTNERTPLLVLGEAGAPPIGFGTELRPLAEFCAQRGLHLHVRGHSLALPATLETDQSCSLADSLTLTPGPWFGIPGLPTITFFKIPEPPLANDQCKAVNSAGSREVALAALAGLTTSGRVSALPLWAAIQAAGSRPLVARLKQVYRSARDVYSVVSNAGLKIVSHRPGGDEPPNIDIVDAVSSCSSCVAFQFSQAGAARPPPYYDKLNSWLGQVLQREADMINIEVCDTEHYGVVLRYCPLEGVYLEEEKVESWAAVLESQLAVLHATVSLREPFRQKVLEHSCLRLVTLSHWAGLGGVRYVPLGWEGAAKTELDALNRQLVDTLRATDGAFSCGDADDNMACVRFGMVTADTDVEELLDLVVSTGKEVEESSKVLSNMTEVLKKGIEEAQADLEREQAERLWQEGVLRRVPVVGRVVDWWAPAPPARGRRLHLALGTLQTTDDVYRCVQKKNQDGGEPARAHSPARQAQSDGAAS